MGKISPLRLKSELIDESSTTSVQAVLDSDRLGITRAAIKIKHRDRIDSYSYLRIEFPPEATQKSQKHA